MRRTVALLSAISIVLPLTAWAATFDVQIQRSDVTFRPERFFVGDLVRVYATVKNVGERDVQGNVFFSENGTAIGTPPPFSVRARGAEEEVWVDWQPVTTGDRQIFIRVVTAPETRDEDPANNEMIVPVFIDRDSDGDGIGDRDEPPPPPPTAPTATTAASGGSAASSPSSSATPPALRPQESRSPSLKPQAPHPPKPPLPEGGGETKAFSPSGVEGERAGEVQPAPVNVAPSPAAPANRAPYDAQLRDLLGRPPSAWARFIPILAGAVALLACIILIVAFVRRRRFPFHDRTPDGSSAEDVGRRSPRVR